LGSTLNPTEQAATTGCGSMTHPRAEHRMLTQAALAGSRSAGADPFHGVRWEGLDWDYAVQIAERLGSLPLLGVALARAGPPRPPAVDQRCREARIRGALRAMVAERILGDIDAEFRRAGVQFMVLKGLPLAQELYGEPGLRPMDDLDVLVRWRSRDRALVAMQAIGYRLPPGSLSLKFYLRHHFHLMMVRQGSSGLPVELHWNTQPYFSTSLIPEDEFWEGSRICRVGSVDVTVPGREEEFLYLVQHLSRHLLGWGPEVAEDPVAVFLDPARRGRLTWLADLHLLSRAEPMLDRERMIRLAEKWFLLNELRSSLRLLEEVCETAVNSSGPRSSAPIVGKKALTGHWWARQAPWLARTSQSLHFRPILAFHVLKFAFPGSSLIRHRFDGRGMGRATLAYRTLLHALNVILKALRMGAAYLLETCLRVILPGRSGRLSS
jgi:hypothetical protein